MRCCSCVNKIISSRNLSNELHNEEFEGIAMPVYIALLRGVNVGKAKRVPMAELKALLAGLGYDRVETLLNSGNAVFHATKASPKELAQEIAGAIFGTFKFEAKSD